MGTLRILQFISLGGYALSTVVFCIWFFRRKAGTWYAGAVLMGAGLASQMAFIIAQGVAAGRPPFSNTFETMVLMAACAAAFFLVSTLFYDTKSLSPLASLAAFLVTLFSCLIMTDEISPLVPALRSRLWLTVHVVFCIVSYAAFLLAYLFALACLARDERHATGAALGVSLNISGTAAAIAVVLLARDESLWQESRGSILLGALAGTAALGVALWPLIGWLARKLGIRERLPEAKQLESMLYGAVALGFPFLTLGIATGSYWANQAWGRYWGWDDKETTALITWFVFAIYLHLRFVPKWRGTWNAWIAVAGFWCVLFTYFGVNYLMSGLHSYA